MKTTKKTVLHVAALAAVSLLAVCRASAQDAPPAVSPAAAHEAEVTAITKCGTCHGSQGNSISPIYPALAGQKAWYIDEQLHLFKAQTRRDPYARGMMWGMAAQLDDVQIAALADYFSKQPAFHSAPAFTFVNDAAARERGKTLYNDGDSVLGIAPCSACHQADAGGNDQFPRLAGQHAPYLLKQLRALHSGSREQVIMNGVAAPLTVPDMKALALYLEALH